VPTASPPPRTPTDAALAVIGVTAPFPARAAGWIAGCVVALVVSWTSLPAAAQDVVVTLLDGTAVVTDGAQRFNAVAGQRPGAAALIETSASTAVVRLEWPDRATVDLGPDTRAMILPAGFEPRSGRAPVLYLLQGWAKVGALAAEPAGGVVTPAMEILPVAGAVVVFANRTERFAFAETGPLDVLERGPAGKRQGIAAGALYAGAGGVLPRPTPAWLSRVPRAFRDPLPRRGAQFKDRTVSASALPPPTYAMLSHWLTAEPALRRDFPRRFAVLLQDPASRRALEEHMSLLPEWKPLLNAPR
jgi:hypothetical protein